MKNQFELVGGSVTGREHLRVGKNNQDAAYWSLTDGGVIAVVCDGCGSGTHSEVGAKLGARMLVAALHRVLGKELGGDLPLDSGAVWQPLQQALLAQLQQVAEVLGGDRDQVVQDFLLFTIAGAVITPAMTAVFSLGDGVVAINGRVMQLGPCANNAPPYLAYGLLRENSADAFQVKVLQALPTDQVQSLLLGTDGLSDLIAVAEKPLPGRSDLVGDIAQFWQGDRYFRNPDQVRRRLTLINRDIARFDASSGQWRRQAGLLPDDTTLVVIRRKEALG